MYLTSSDVVEAIELYGASSLSEVKIDKFLSTAEGAELKRKKSEEVGLAQKRMRVEEQEVAKRFINSMFPEVDRCRAREEVLSHGGVGIVQHVLEAANLVNALSQEFFETLKERNTLAKENEDLRTMKEEVEKDLAKAMPELMHLQEENDLLKMKLMFEERKRKMCRTIFPLNFDFKFIVVEEEAEVGEIVPEEKGNQKEANQPTPLAE
ncbi:hypothetical protein SLEP1_g42388 [Rubroshorea leprosula]|uniref:Uncharacterized protein n=1 Tax=Rubroshorea leprosula TaxID=152421 RepID=A0AAV5LAJ6_9ROSI|nr:hypothetical protein SLEP1_g42388 [Rubroshorea leprosula]